MKYFELLLERKERRRSYLKNINFYLSQIKQTVIKKFPNAKIFVFGSYVKGEFSANSDIDILVILNNEIDTRRKNEIILEIKEKIGLLSPFEIHITSLKEYESWWKNFIKDDYMEI